MAKQSHKASQTEFVQEWNEMLPFKISEQKLSAPTYDFAVTALETLLRKLNVNVDYIRQNVPENDARRMFNIQFVKVVDRYYKLYNKTNTFYYMDLIQPESKKLLHVLKMVFNYLKFYYLRKKEVAEKVTEHLAKYHEVLQTKNELESKIEKNRQHEKKMEQEIVKFEEELPQMNETIAAHRDRVKQLDKEIAKKSMELRQVEYAVAAREVNELEKEYQQAVDEVNFVRESAMETKKQNADMQKFLKTVNRFIENTPLAELREIVQMQENLEDLKDDVAAKNRALEILAQKREIFAKEVVKLNDEIIEAEAKAKIADEAAKTSIAEWKEKIKAEEDKLKAARLERTKAETNLQEEKENRQFMLDSFDRLLRQIADPFAGHATDESSNNNNNN